MYCNDRPGFTIPHTQDSPSLLLLLHLPLPPPEDLTIHHPTGPVPRTALHTALRHGVATRR